MMKNPTCAVLVFIGIILCCLGRNCYGFVFSATPVVQYEHELTAHIVDHLETVRHSRGHERRLNEALEMIPIILKYCEQYNVDPLRVATVATYENSWRQKPRGTRGEVGPMQVMPKYFKKAFDLDTLDGQIHAGIHYIKIAMDKCSKSVQVFHYYRYSKCEPVKGFAWFRELKYNQAVEKYRTKRERR